MKSIKKAILMRIIILLFLLTINIKIIILIQETDIITLKSNYFIPKEARINCTKKGIFNHCSIAYFGDNQKKCLIKKNFLVKPKEKRDIIYYHNDSCNLNIFNISNSIRFDYDRFKNFFDSIILFLSLFIINYLFIIYLIIGIIYNIRLLFKIDYFKNHEGLLISYIRASRKTILNLHIVKFEYVLPNKEKIIINDMFFSEIKSNIVDLIIDPNNTQKYIVVSRLNQNYLKDLKIKKIQ